MFFFLLLNLYYFLFIKKNAFRKHSSQTNNLTQKNTKKMSSTEFSRLPNDVVPIHYELELKPNLVDFTFTGRVTIDVKVSRKQTTSRTI